jgi:hypothetical protein
MVTVKQAQNIAGTLSNPSKMPGKGTSTPATRCITGSKLRNVSGSVCEGCYAMKGFYIMDNVRPALEKRFVGVMESKHNPEPWINAMVHLITRQEYFRWHDSGDLQGAWHLANIAEVAKRTPNVKHWIPTREYRMVKDYLADGGTIPENLVVRISAHMVNAAAPNIAGLPTSTVVTNESATCPARFQDNACGDCRRCWDPDVKTVSYHKH